MMSKTSDIARGITFPDLLEVNCKIAYANTKCQKIEYVLVSATTVLVVLRNNDKFARYSLSLLYRFWKLYFGKHI